MTEDRAAQIAVLAMCKPDVVFKALKTDELAIPSRLEGLGLLKYLGGSDKEHEYRWTITPAGVRVLESSWAGRDDADHR